MKITINGVSCQAQEGTTVLAAARANGIYIPSLCFHPKTGAAARCRACAVDIEGMRGGLQTACSTPVRDGMVIRTDSEAVKTAQTMVINLLLANGQHDCLACEKSGVCELQDAAYHLGIPRPDLTLREAVPQAPDHSSAFIRVDREKCIKCGRCVTACNQNVVNEVLSFGGRGETTRVICDADQPMGESRCVQCGECVQMCPVGALVEKKAVGKGRRWQTRKVRTTCPYCGVGCQLDLHVKGEQIVRVTGVEDAEPNQGHLCVKGRFGYDFIYAKDRLTKPLIRGAEGFREANWDEALDLVAAKFKEAIAQSGPDSVAGISCARSTNEASYNMQKLFRAAIGTNNIDHCARTCHAPTVAGLATSFGSGAMTNSFKELSKAKLIFCIGTNMTEAHPVASYYVKQAVRNGAKLIVADPRQHALALEAHLFAQIKVGSDVAFLNGLMHVLVTENLQDQAYIDAHCENFPELRDKVLEYPPERASAISGVPADQIREIARTLAAHKPGAVCYTLGITEHTCGTQNVMSIANLQMMLGNLGMEGGGVNPLRGQNNVQGACDMGALPGDFPGYQKVVSPQARAKFAEAWGVDTLPDQPGLMIPDMITGLQSKQIRALYVFGENLANSEPNIHHVEQCLASADFLVCNDIFPTETTRFAHVVLPAAAWGEDEGTFTNSERRVSRVRKIKNAPGEAKPDWWIFKEIARRMGSDWASGSAQEIWDNEVSALAPALGGIKYGRLEGDGLQWPCPTIEHPGTTFLHKDGAFTRGKGLFQAFDWAPPAEVADPEYPFVLSTGRRLYHYHTRTQTGRSGMDQLLSREAADLSVADARRLGLADGDLVLVRSRRGEIKVPCRITPEVPAGLVWMSFHFREGNANWLTNDAGDAVTKTAEFKACAVNVLKVMPGEASGREAVAGEAAIR
jgi:formate dehydrogenase major subunit